MRQGADWLHVVRQAAFWAAVSADALAATAFQRSRSASAAFRLAVSVARFALSVAVLAMRSYFIAKPARVDIAMSITNEIAPAIDIPRRNAARWRRPLHQACEREPIPVEYTLVYPVTHAKFAVNEPHNPCKHQG